MSSPAARLFALVPAAGFGSRAGTGQPKQYVPVAGRPLVAHTLDALSRVGRLSATLVVLAPQDDLFESLVPGFAGERGWLARCGGATRAASVAAGLDALRERGAADRDWVLVHDAARCLLQPAWVDRLIDEVLAAGQGGARGEDVGGLLAQPLADTLKAEAGGRVAATLDRRGKWAAQTPQMFRLGLLCEALEHAGPEVTDESGAVEALGLAPLLVPGPLENFKVTFAADIELAACLLVARLREGGS